MKQKFQKGDVVKHILGEKLLIVKEKESYMGNHTYAFNGYYYCQRSNFHEVIVHESELKKITK